MVGINSQIVIVLKQQWPAMACTSLGYQPGIINQGEAHTALLSLLNYEQLVDSGEGRHCLSIDELTMR